MPIRRGAEYLDSLRDGREVWLRGERVDVTADPRLAGCAHAFAELYDLQHDPALAARLTMPSPESGEPVSLAYLLPRTVDDLIRKREMIAFLARHTGGVVGRLPEYIANVVLGLYDVRETLGAEDPAFAANATTYFAYCRERDLCVSLGFVDPQRDRGRPSGDFEFLRVVAERADGIVVRGAKGVATLAPYANEFICLSLPREGMTPDHVVHFAVPIATPGLKIVCREPLAPRYPDEHPLAARYDEMDAWVILDDVFVPQERVFYRRRVDRIGALHKQILAWGYHHNVVRMVVKAEVLLGLCLGMADYLGTRQVPHVQEGLADAICYLETLRALMHEAERNPVASASGLALPNPTQITIARVYGVEREPRILHVVRELCSSGILMAPAAADLASPALGGYLYRYLVGKDERAPERFRLLKLAWDYAVDSFGSRQLLFDMFNASDLHANKAGLVAAYDGRPAAALARRLAGIPGDAPVASVGATTARRASPGE
ncbi:MAG TPA: 4-hydroxyphenylacetate 3-hydroxylase N-terminal domain-containing protein [Chloroflexota bacterium]|nr:4-hydroxyphenylacetate 3-hydroxylase N-terminal domain-containing protein [Chloroflexota bacterium]